MIMDCLGVEKNELTIGGVKVSTLTRKYGTPLYIMDEARIRENCRAYKSALAEYYSGESDVLYASKAFCCKLIYQILAEEGVGADIVSGGELYTTVLAGFLGSRVYFHGHNKSLEEIELGVEHGIHAFVADSIQELKNINMVANESNRKMNVMIRVSPNVSTNTHQHVQTGQMDSKFGFSLGGEAENAFTYAKSLKHLNIIGIHCHIGSQIFETESFVAARDNLVEFSKMLKEKHNIIIQELNLGGGLGIKYTKKDKPPTIENFVKAIAKDLETALNEANIPLPKLILEPGRSIVGDAGITAYTIGTIKEIPGVRKYINVDGGMTDNPRYVMYASKYEALRIANPLDSKKEKVTIAGKCCESGDLIAENVSLPQVKTGDIIAVQCTGAYNYSMSSNYNRNPRPAVVMVSNGTSRTAIERETYEDMGRYDK